MLHQQRLKLPNIRRWGFSVALLALSLFPVAQSAAQERKPITVVAARQGPVIDRIAVVGTLVAREEIRVNPLIQGKEVRQILVEVGDRVEAGQPLAILDDTEVGLLLDKNGVQGRRAEAAVAQQRSKIESALITERETRKLLDRSRLLLAKGVVSEQILDERQNAHARAVSDLEIARQTLALAKADSALIDRERDETQLTVDRSIVRAPASGLILSRTARIGVMTSSSSEPLFVIAEKGDIEMEASVSETALARLKEGMAAEVSRPGNLKPLQGKVRLSAAQINPATRMGTVRIDLVEEDGLIVGAFSRGTITLLQRPGILVPGTAVRRTNGKSSLYVVKNGIVQPRDITVGLQQGNLLEITQGLAEGELVVLKAGNALKANEQIAPVLVAGPRRAETDVAANKGIDVQ